MKLLLIAAVSLLSACATCREHQVACTVGAVLVTGAVIVIASNQHSAYQAQPIRGWYTKE